jgi:hypothetical protein
VGPNRGNFALTLSRPSYQALKRILARGAAARKASAAADKPMLQQQGESIRGIAEYQAFWDEYCQLAAQGVTDPSPTTDR